MKISGPYVFVQAKISSEEMEQVKSDCTHTEGETSVYVDIDMYVDYTEANKLVNEVLNTHPSADLIEFYR